jgi:hypothetical protein
LHHRYMFGDVRIGDILYGDYITQSFFEFSPRIEDPVTHVVTFPQGSAYKGLHFVKSANLDIYAEARYFIVIEIHYGDSGPPVATVLPFFCYG